jgi:hypothetical protein
MTDAWINLAFSVWLQKISTNRRRRRRRAKQFQIAQKLRYRADAVQAGHGIAGRRELDFEIKFDGYRCIASP